jgi:hypothetical protein
MAVGYSALPSAFSLQPIHLSSYIKHFNIVHEIQSCRSPWLQGWKRALSLSSSCQKELSATALSQQLSFLLILLII